MLFGGDARDRRLPLTSRDMFSNIKPCRDIYLKLYDYDLMFLEVGECIFDFDFTKDKLFFSQVKTVDHAEKINESCFEREHREYFMRIHYLSSYLLFFYYAGFKYKSFRYRTNKIFNNLQNYRNREFAYYKISNDMFPAFQKSLNRTLFSQNHKNIVDGMLYFYQIVYGEVIKNNIDSMVVEPDLIINWD